MNQTNNPGPVTQEGKAISSKNALKHGCCALTTLFLPSESPEGYHALTSTWCKAYNPQTEPERHLVQELINADWLLQRVTRAHAEVESHLYTEKPNPMDWTEAQERKLGRHLRYKTANTNLVLKARKAVEDYRKARLTEKTNSDKLTIQKERLEVYKAKNRTEPTWKEHLENMRQQAISMGYVPPGFDPTKK